MNTAFLGDISIMITKKTYIVKNNNDSYNDVHDNDGNTYIHT